MQKRLFLLPLVWAAFGIADVLVLAYLFGPIVNNIPYVPNDKPIGGSFLPALFFNLGALLVVFALSFYSLGIWNIDLSTRKSKTDVIALGLLVVSGGLIFYAAIFVFPLMVALVYLLAVHLE